MTKLDEVNKLRASLKLGAKKRLPRSLGSRCEHCLSDITDDELDHERCNHCGLRLDVRMTEDEWIKQMSHK